MENERCFSLADFGHFLTFPRGGWGKIEIKDHLSLAETEIGAELGKKNKQQDIGKLCLGIES